jgi:hypothetical protein
METRGLLSSSEGPAITLYVEAAEFSQNPHTLLSFDPF